LEATYEMGRTYLEMGERLGDSSSIEQARALFAQIGAKWDLAQADDLLKSL
jgi:hypothetical protein